MSAFTVGTQTSKLTPAGQKNDSRRPGDEGPGKAFIKWIPGDAIVFYTALLALGASQKELTGDETAQELLSRIDAGSVKWFAFALATSAVLVAIGAFAPSGNKKPVAIWPLLVRILLTLLAFTLWTTLLPGAWAYDWHLVRDMGAAYVLVIAVVALVFTAIAELVTRKTNS